MPEIRKYSVHATMAANAAARTDGTRSASGSTSGHPNRTMKKMIPPTSTMCTPEIESRCARPDNRSASASAGVTKLLSPDTIAAAIPPPPGPAAAFTFSASARRTAPSQWNTASTVAEGGRVGRGSHAPKANPTPPSCWNHASR